DIIPYHARENAQPFTYGNLPTGFNTTDLNRVCLDGDFKISNLKHIQDMFPHSPSTTRKSTRPSISSSRPLIRKTPTRQEFEEMLLERKEQSQRNQKNSMAKNAQDVLIQRDLVELHGQLNKVLGSTSDNNNNNCSSNELERHLESIDLPDDTVSSTEKNRSETPTFPVDQKSFNYERSYSSYPSENEKPLLSDDQLMQDQPINCNSFIKDLEPYLVKFASDSTEFWYKPHMSREEAVLLLRSSPPGTFIIRNSTTYHNAFGLVLRVAKAPPGTPINTDFGDELVRHFLIEATTRGVRLKGCNNEPMFSSLSAFVNQHSNNSLALPSTLIIPTKNFRSPTREELITKQKLIVSQGAACNVLFLYQCDMETLTGDEAVLKAIYKMFTEEIYLKPIEVHLKISVEGITLTDNTRKTFFRRHYGAQHISHFSMDPNHRFWSVLANDEGLNRSVNKSIFAFIARPLTGVRDNQCHVFCDLASTQPAAAIVSFAHKVL
ncbi:hypothetical protein KR009_000608, partial [Drosophila setifemur]